MDRVARIELVVTFDRVLDLSILGVCVHVAIVETDRVGSGTARE